MIREMSFPSTSTAPQHALPSAVAAADGFVVATSMQPTPSFLHPTATLTIPSASASIPSLSSSALRSQGSTDEATAASVLLEAASAAAASSPLSVTSSHVAVAASPSSPGLAVTHLSRTASSTAGIMPVEYLCWSSATPTVTVAAASVPSVVVTTPLPSLPFLAPHQAARALLARSNFSSQAASLHLLQQATQEGTRRMEEYRRLQENLDPRNILPRAAANECTRPSSLSSSPAEDSEEDYVETPDDGAPATSLDCEDQEDLAESAGIGSASSVSDETSDESDISVGDETEDQLSNPTEISIRLPTRDTARGLEHDPEPQ